MKLSDEYMEKEIRVRLNDLAVNLGSFHNIKIKFQMGETSWEYFLKIKISSNQFEEQEITVSEYFDNSETVYIHGARNVFKKHLVVYILSIFDYKKIIFVG